MSIKKDILWRVAFVYVATLALALVIIGKIAYLQFIERSKWTEKAEQLALRDITIEPNRGDIYAEGDRLLAISVPYYEIRMDLGTKALTNSIFNNNIDSLALCLSNLFKDKSKEAYKRDLIQARRENKRYHLVKRRVSYAQLQQLKTFPIFRLGRYGGGFIYIQDNRRMLPHGNLASRTIGYITKSKSGNVVGIEGAYDTELRGVMGVRLMQRLAGGVWMPVNNRNEVEPKDGMDIVTTIDVDIQDVAESALLRQLIRHKAHHGTAVLMEVKTGAIKAIANLELDRNGNYREMYNYAVGASVEPGSTFKLPVLMAAMEDGFVKLTDTIDTGNGQITFFDKTIRDTERDGFGRISVQQVFEVSSNVGIAKIISDHYKGKETRLIDRLYRMNLNEMLGVEIRGEGKPNIKYPGDKYWSGISLPMMSHGYEVELTPLQVLSFYNAVANNGTMVKPKFVKELRYHGEIVKSFKTEVINPSIASSSTIKNAQKMLEGVVENGTARNLRNSDYKIAGKTGTAQIANKKYGYKQEYVASFVGYFPSENPKYSCIVTISSPSNNVYYGNLVAGPVFKEIADKVYATSLEMHQELIFDKVAGPVEAPYTKSGYRKELEFVLEHLMIPYFSPVEEPSYWVTTIQRDSSVYYFNRDVSNYLLPNVKGMGLNDAVYLLENLGGKIEVRGRGTVVDQQPSAGTKIGKGQTIILEMSII